MHSCPWRLLSSFRNKNGLARSKSIRTVTPSDRYWPDHPCPILNEFHKKNNSNKIEIFSWYPMILLFPFAIVMQNNKIWTLYFYNDNNNKTIEIWNKRFLVSFHFLDPPLIRPLFKRFHRITNHRSAYICIFSLSLEKNGYYSTKTTGCPHT